MKNRKFNKGLKNLATWGYFANAGNYGEGTPAAGGPFFPRLEGKKILQLSSSGLG